MLKDFDILPRYDVQEKQNMKAVGIDIGRKFTIQ